jgi:uncharacterized cupin superfamily protein
MTETVEKHEVKNHQVHAFGPFARLDEQRWQHPTLDLKARGKVFMKEKLGLTGLEVSLNKFRPGWGSPFLHKHARHEELYLCLGGKGEMIVDGEVIPLEQGTAVRVAPEGARAVRNVSGEDFFYLCIQATAGTMSDDETVTDGRPVMGPVPWPA